MAPEDDFMERAVARIYRWMAYITTAGTAAAFVGGGWPGATGFLIGAIASFLNFRWLTRLVYALSQTQTGEGKPRWKRYAILMGLRYLLLCVGAYVILNYTTLSLPAALTGLFISVAAVIVEILFELVYAGT